MKTGAGSVLKKCVLILAAVVSVMMLDAFTVMAAKYTTKYNGTNYKRVYDYEYYTTKVHPELAGESGEEVIKYFVKNGIPEGEQAISTFSVKSYRHANADLRKAYGKDYASYVAHYMKKGFAENRTTTGWDDKFKDPVTSYNNKSYSRVYDFYFYIGKYASVRKKYADDDIGALQYFVKKGIKKKHQASEDFNVVWYYNANPTLRGTCGQTWSRYYEYYQRKGYKKGKVTACPNLVDPISYYKYGSKKIDLSKIYDFEFFTKNNASAYKYWKKQDDAGAIKYFVKTGMLAGMRGNAEFDSTSSAYRKAKKKVFPYLKDNEYALADILSSKTKYLILVNQGKHMVYVFTGERYNWKKIMSFPCVVGAPGTPTGVGSFRIFLKRTYFTTNHDSAKCWYFSVFNGDQGFHSVIYDMSETPVHLIDGSLGVSISHGCVRVGLSNAKWIFDTVPIGTRVKVYNRPW